jgi:molybdopterin-binding protein
MVGLEPKQPREHRPASADVSPRISRERGTSVGDVTQLRIRDAAAFLGVSDDTVRRVVDTGALTATVDHAGRKTIDGYELAMYARAQSSTVPDPSGVGSSARNRFVGLVTAIQSDAVMSQVEMQCGPFRVVSLMSSEAVRDLQLELGSVAVAVIKSTTVIVETKGTTA